MPALCPQHSHLNPAYGSCAPLHADAPAIPAERAKLREARRAHERVDFWTGVAQRALLVKDFGSLSAALAQVKTASDKLKGAIQ